MLQRWHQGIPPTLRTEVECRRLCPQILVLSEIHDILYLSSNTVSVHQLWICGDLETPALTRYLVVHRKRQDDSELEWISKWQLQAMDHRRNGAEPLELKFRLSVEKNNKLSCESVVQSGSSGREEIDAKTVRERAARMMMILTIRWSIVGVEVLEEPLLLDCKI